MTIAQAGVFGQISNCLDGASSPWTERTHGCAVGTDARAGNASTARQIGHRFLDPINVGLTAMEGGALLADGVTTRRALDKSPSRVREADPIARIFVSHGWWGQIVGGVVFIAADVGLRYAVHRKGHHRMERWLPAILTVYGVLGTVQNVRVLHELDRNHR